LPHAQSEAQFISGLFDKPTLLVKNSATLAAVQRKLKQAEIFHFAGHALFTSGGGGLLLAGQNSNYILDGTHLDLIRPRLVVLSACSTETGEPGAINSEGMVRAFLTSGASQVVAARWSVDSLVTEKFMKTFYQTMFQKKPSFLALQKAAADVMNYPPTAHPYYWASFNLYVAD
jgi:CHAT domain-containing protein